MSTGRYGKYRAKKKFTSVERHSEIDEEFNMKTASQVTKELGNMKGALMKIGQMVSYLDTGLPDNVKTTLSSLQSDAPPMSGDLAQKQIEKELGKPLSQIFSDWDPVPIASASIGQVHKAITKEGEAVAVKVQYPYIDNILESDLKKADLVFSGLTKLYPGVNSAPIADEIRDRLSEELNYELEITNQRFFYDYFKGHPFVSIPKVYPDLSSRRVLTSELIVGSRFSQIQERSQAEKNLISETLYRFSFGAIYQLNAFNGDPHPGNYIFGDNGQVTFLDFGLVKKFDDSERLLFQTLISHMVIEPDIVAFRAMVEDVGILAKGLDFSDELVKEYFQYFYEYVMKDEVTVIDTDYAETGVKRLFDMNGEYGELMKHLNIPPSMVIVQRITLGLMGIFAKLDATANWRAIAEEIWPFVEREPSTEMGIEIAKWEQSKKSI